MLGQGEENPVQIAVVNRVRQALELFDLHAAAPSERWGAASDWLEESGETVSAQAFRDEAYGSGYGSGYGYGHGYGHGYGDGHGYGITVKQAPRP